MPPLPKGGGAGLCYFPVSDVPGCRQGSGTGGRSEVLAVQDIISLTYKHWKMKGMIFPLLINDLNI